MPSLRDFKLEDIQPIDEIFRNQPDHNIPGLKHLIANATITDDNDKVIGYGVVKLFAEGVLLIDKRIRKRDKALAVKLSVEKAICEAKKHGIEQLYFVTGNSSFADVLRKHWGFKNLKEEVLVLHLEG